MAGGGVRLEERLDVVGCSPIHCSEGQYQGLESDTGRDRKPVEGDEARGSRTCLSISRQENTDTKKHF